MYSLELWSIILRACAEIDSHLHSLLEELGIKRGQTGMYHYRNAEPQLQLSGFALTTIPGRLEIRPFEAFSVVPPVAPRWWQDYNSIKHNRLESIRTASFENAVSAVAGVAAVLYRQWGEYIFPRALYLNTGPGYIAPFPSQLFTMDRVPWQ